MQQNGRVQDACTPPSALPATHLAAASKAPRRRKHQSHRFPHRLHRTPPTCPAPGRLQRRPHFSRWQPRRALRLPRRRVWRHYRLGHGLQEDSRLPHPRLLTQLHLVIIESGSCREHGLKWRRAPPACRLHGLSHWRSRCTAGHTLDDQAETSTGLSRGPGTRSLAGTAAEAGHYCASWPARTDILISATLKISLLDRPD